MNPAHDKLPSEIDFSQGQRGKSYRPGAKLRLPVGVDDPVQQRLTALSSLINDLLRKDIERIEAAR